MIKVTKCHFDPQACFPGNFDDFEKLTKQSSDFYRETDMELFETTKRHAAFSADKKYRYRLEIIWDKSLPLVNFLMLNPSIADSFINDPTVERCQRRAAMWKFGGLIVTNLFALVSTDPQGLRDVLDPVGPGNDNDIELASRDSHMTICAWGARGGFMGRSKHVRELLKDKPLHYLKMGKKEPSHPLYLSYELDPIRWERQ